MASNAEPSVSVRISVPAVKATPRTDGGEGGQEAAALRAQAPKGVGHDGGHAGEPACG
jgi:hypothetical protein